MNQFLVCDGCQKNRRRECLAEQRKPCIPTAEVTQDNGVQRQALKCRAILAQRPFIGRTASHICPRLLTHTLTREWLVVGHRGNGCRDLLQLGKGAFIGPIFRHVTAQSRSRL
jgi:hypothetical protein